MVWRGTFWHGIVWHGMAWRGTVWHGNHCLARHVLDAACAEPVLEVWQRIDYKRHPRSDRARD
jgi:hypothetical protein